MLLSIVIFLLSFIADELRFSPRFNSPFDNKRITGEIFSHNMLILWQDREVSWRYFSLDFGIRRSDKWQWIPIRYFKNNCEFKIMFGFWKLFISPSFHW